MRIIIIAISIILAGCAATEFQSSESKTSTFEGRDGKTVVDGIEIWGSGEPSRQYKVLGIIEEKRPSGFVPKHQLESDIARKARALGGDAVISMGSYSEITGYQSKSYATGALPRNSVNASGFAVPVNQKISKYTVIKYLD